MRRRVLLCRRAPRGDTGTCSDGSEARPLLACPSGADCDESEPGHQLASVDETGGTGTAATAPGLQEDRRSDCVDGLEEDRSDCVDGLEGDRRSHF